MQLAAGDTPLLSAFTQGNVIFLQAQSTRQHLRIFDGGCDGNGGNGQYAQFVVHVRRPGVIALQNVADKNRWLAICEGKTTGTGHGGPYCELLVGELEGRYVVLESCQSPGQRVGVQANGRMLQPYNTGTGLSGRFIPIVHQKAPVQPQAYPQTYPSATQPPPYAPPAQPYQQAYPQPYAAQNQAAYPAPSQPYSTDHYPPPPAQPYLPGPPGAPQPYAPTGPPGAPQPYAPTGPPGAPQPYAPTGPPGAPQPYAPTGPPGAPQPYETYAPMCPPGAPQPYAPTGPPQPYAPTGPPGAPQPYAPTGPPVSQPYAPPVYAPPSSVPPPQQMYPTSPASPMSVSSNDPAPGVPLCVGTTPVLSCFTEGNIVLLKSKATLKNLRITGHGVVEGTGGNGTHAQFTVHVRRQGVAALQNVNNPAHWLSIEGGLTKTSNGSHFCDFYVKDLDGLNVAFESVMSPGNHVGILPDGTIKLPNQTGTGQHAKFTPSVYYRNPQPPSMTAPPLNSYPITTPPSQPPPHQYPQPTHQPPPQATAKSSLLSVFGQGCNVFLRCRSTGRNLRLRNNTIDGSGGEGQFAKFIVHVRRPGVVALQSFADTRRWISITGKGHLDGKGGEQHPWTELTVKQISDDYVVLESATFPGWHVGILPTGEPKVASNTGTGHHGQFFPYLVR